MYYLSMQHREPNLGGFLLVDRITRKKTSIGDYLEMYVNSREDYYETTIYTPSDYQQKVRFHAQLVLSSDKQP